MDVVKRALVVGLAIGIAACTALLGIDKDYQLGTSEAGSEAGDSSPETATESGPPDATFETSTCELMHTFCDDFDKNGLGIGWTGTLLGSSAKMMLDTSAFVSAPKSLACETVMRDAAANDPQTEAHLVRTVLGKYSQLVAEADVRIDQAPSDPGLTVELMGVAMIAQAGNPNWHVALHHYATKLQVVEKHFGYPDGGYDYIFIDVPQQFNIGKWTHVRIEVGPNGAKTHAKVTIGGGIIFDQDLIEVWPKATRAEIQVGTYAMYWGGEHWSAHFDNVTLDLQ